ncbi:MULTISPECIES: pyrroloquinoline quinone precursor peptide PqqA [Streptomyces]|uniref:Pyrroloquinoline quinone peptide PqqA n=1 Tax=Streptomyces ramulosus TaxID=47762 RepID=A0ABW1FDF5_9ACTN
MARHEERHDSAPRPQEHPAGRPDTPTDETRWHKPDYQVVEASLEVSAYYLTQR